MIKKEEIKRNLESIISNNKEFIISNGGKVSDYLLNNIEEIESKCLEHLTEIERESFKNDFVESFHFTFEIKEFIRQNYDYYLYPSFESKITKDTYLIATFYDEWSVGGYKGHQNCTYSKDIVKGIDNAIDKLIELARKKDKTIRYYTSLKDVKELIESYDFDEEDEMTALDLEDMQEIYEGVPSWALNYKEGDEVLVKDREQIYKRGDLSVNLPKSSCKISIIPLNEVEEKVNLTPQLFWINYGAITGKEFFQELNKNK